MMKTWRNCFFTSCCFWLSMLTPMNSIAQTESLAELESRKNWMQAELTLDNSGYAATRSAIDKAVRSGASPQTLEERYRLKGRDKYDSQKVFRWAYAAYRKYKKKPENNALLRVSESMNTNFKPGAYDWVRLRFLVACLGFMPSANDLIPAGKRLIEFNSKDEEVIFHLVRVMSLGEALEDRQQAVDWASKWAKKFPGDAYWQWNVASALGGVYEYSSKTATYALNQQNIMAFKRVLNLLPFGHPLRARVVDNIVRLDLDFDSKGRPVSWTMAMYKQALQNSSLR